MSKVKLEEAAREIMNQSVKKSGSETAGSIKDPKENDTGPAVTKNTDSAKNYNKDVSKDTSDPTDDADKGEQTPDKLDKSKKPPKNTKGEPIVDNDGIKKEEKDVVKIDGETKGKSKKDKDDNDDDTDDNDNNDNDMDESRKESLKNYLNDKIEIDVSEDIKAMFKGSDLSEEFIKRATTIFEAAVKGKIKEISEELAGKYDEILAEEVEQIDEELSSSVADFLKLCAKEWLSENEVSIEKSLRADIAEDLMVGLRNLFIENYIDVPEDKKDIVSELQEQNNELTESLNEETSKKIKTYKYIQELERTIAFNELIKESNLTLEQENKITNLAENIESDDVDEFIEKVSTLIESYTTGKDVSGYNKSDNKLINEDNNDNSLEFIVDKDVQQMAKALNIKK